jgi:hypothetical protein
MRPTLVSAAFSLLVATSALSPRPVSAGCEPTWGVRLSSPQIVSASGGILIGKLEPDQPPPPGSFLPHGLILQVEPGLGGGKVSVGYAKGLLPYAAGGVKLSALRTWGHPLWAEPRATYVGLEAEAAFFIQLSVGLLKRVGGNTASPGLIVTGGIGLGF